MPPTHSINQLTFIVDVDGYLIFPKGRVSGFSMATDNLWNLNVIILLDINPDRFDWLLIGRRC
jgi:hypothetical protein